MERCCGIELRHVWDNVSDRQKATILQKIVSYEVNFAKSSRPMHGSFYYASDIAESEQKQFLDLVLIEDHKPVKFVVGPTTNREFLDHGRANVFSHQGPCERNSGIP